MDKLSDVLGQRPLPSGDSITTLKRYLIDTYDEEFFIERRGNTIFIIVPSAAFAQTLRMSLHAIKAECGVTEKLALRIGINSK